VKLAIGVGDKGLKGSEIGFEFDIVGYGVNEGANRATVADDDSIDDWSFGEFDANRFLRSSGAAPQAGQWKDLWCRCSWTWRRHSPRR
jgi:hypothetical protein